MSATTKIQWCHSTVNPVMGCDGCELWPSRAQVVAELASKLSAMTGSLPESEAVRLVTNAIRDAEMSQIYRSRESLASRLQCEAGLPASARVRLVDEIRRLAKCYAGLLGTNRAGHNGYADQFEEPKHFPSRVAKVAS